MAIINRGRILLEAEPMQAMSEIRGRIWRRVVGKEALPQIQRDHRVISTTLLGGRTVVHVYDEALPGPGFEATEPDLTDVYFSTMAGHIGRHRAASAQPVAAEA